MTTLPDIARTTATSEHGLQPASGSTGHRPVAPGDPTGAMAARSGQIEPSLEFARALSPHPNPLPRGEGETHPASLANDRRWIRATPARVRPPFPLPRERARVRGTATPENPARNPSLQRPRSRIPQPQRGVLRQPRAKPWVTRPKFSPVLKGRNFTVPPLQGWRIFPHSHPGLCPGLSNHALSALRPQPLSRQLPSHAADF